MTLWDKVKRAGGWFSIGFGTGFAVRSLLHASNNPDLDDARDDERVTRTDVERSVAELRDIVGDIGTGIHVSQQRLENAQRATDTIERGLGYIGDGIDGVREATGQLRAILERTQGISRCPRCGALCGDIYPQE